MTEYAIEIKNLVKRFGSFTAVDNISLSIRRGEIFGILGPNGAGKTTTINLILGLLSITSGRILINGMDINTHKNEIKSEIGHMMQETVVEPDLTARQNLTLFAELYHVPKKEIPSRVEEALKEAQLVEFADKKAGTFSGGMKRRLDLVQAMTQRPKILILDEPTTGLDVQNRVEMWDHIRDLNKRGVTIILTTQYLEEADLLCNRIAIIDHGKIKAIGTPSELKKLVGSGNILRFVVGHDQVDKAASILRKDFGLSPSVKNEVITAEVGKTDWNLLAKVTEKLQHNGIPIFEVSMHLPTLDDVFIKLTGSALRDATGDMQSRAEAVRWGR
ncbi:MAG: ABC transporter ATP-binding protein [Candidatus Micrarchaeia archaeon]